MKRLYAILAMSVFLVLSGCGDEVTNYDQQYDENYTDGRVIGTIHGVVFNSVDNERLANVSVYTAVKGAIVRAVTNSRGYYVITGLPPGDYSLSFVAPTVTRADNFSIGEYMTSIPTLEDLNMEDIPSSVSIPWSEMLDVTLIPLNAGLSGQVFKQVDAEEAQPAEGVTVIADFAGLNLSVDEFSTLTDASGGYAFTNLPAAALVMIRNLPFNDGTNNFAAAFLPAVPLTPNGLEFADPLLCNRTGVDPIILANNFENDNFAVDGNVDIEFSLPMDVPRSDVSLWRGGLEIPTEVTWTGDTQVSLNPHPVLLPGTVYTVTIDVWTTAGVNYTPAPVFNTVPGIQLLSTNLETADGWFNDFPPNDPIDLVFSATPDLGNLNGVFDLTRGGILVHTAVTQAGDVVTITPTGGLTPGITYQLDYTVYSNFVGDFTTGTLVFATLQSIALPPVVPSFALTTPGMLYDYNATAVSFDWQPMNNVDGFAIFASNNVDRSDMVQVGDFAAGAQTGVANLQAAVFGTNPFEEGTEVTFKVAAYTAAGLGALSAGIVVKDEELPLNTGDSQSGTADNDPGATELSITLDIFSSEPLDPSIAISVLVLDGGDAFVLSSGSVVTEYIAGGVRLNITVPADSDASGDTIVLSGDIQDTSGNLMANVSVVLF